MLRSLELLVKADAAMAPDSRWAVVSVGLLSAQAGGSRIRASRLIGDFIVTALSYSLRLGRKVRE